MEPSLADHREHNNLTKQQSNANTSQHVRQSGIFRIPAIRDITDFTRQGYARWKLETVAQDFVKHQHRKPLLNFIGVSFPGVKERIGIHEGRSDDRIAKYCNVNAHYLQC